MEPFLEHDPLNHRTVAMWEECGMKFRANIIRPGGRIELHRHSYDHVAMVTAGWFDCEITAPNGEVERFQVASKDYQSPSPYFFPKTYRIVIPAWYQHTFILREARNVGEILCFWPVGGDQ